MKKPLQIGTVAAACGERVKGKLFVGEFSTGTEVYLPVVILNGAQDGPVIWVNACVHGNELNGTLAAQKLARELDPRDIRGAVVITPFPILSPTAKKSGFPSSRATMAWAKIAIWVKCSPAEWMAA